MTPLTDAEIQAMRERADQACPGPWDARVNEFSNTARPRFLWCEYGWIGELYGSSPMENADFIAHAREDLPRCLDEIDRLKAEVSEKCEKIDTLKRQHLREILDIGHDTLENARLREALTNVKQREDLLYDALDLIEATTRAKECKLCRYVNSIVLKADKSWEDIKSRIAPLLEPKP